MFIFLSKASLKVKRRKTNLINTQVTGEVEFSKVDFLI